MKKQYILIGIITVIVLLSIIYGFTVIGFPADSRGKKFDTTRISNLRSIKNSIDNYAQNNKKLPQSIQNVVINNTYLKINDPETKKPYEYYITGTKSYKLCANFSTSYDDPQSSEMTLYDYSYTSNQFRHKKGYNCFPFTTQPERTYPIQNITPTIEQNKIFTDKNIESVSTTTSYDQSSKFPEGFFSENSNEYGLIVYSNRSIYVYVNFIKPVKLANISSTFSECPQGKCDTSSITRTWTVEGSTNDGQNISMASNEKQSSSSAILDIPVVTNEEFTRITFRTTGPLLWKKMKFTYK